MQKLLLRVEGVAILIISVYFYSYLHYSWLVFIILLFVPDLAALGYLKNVKIGSIVYNLFHSYTIRTGILLFSFFLHHEISLMRVLIWISHIAMDRIFGYGLKYSTTFQHTHLNRV